VSLLESMMGKACMESKVGNEVVGGCGMVCVGEGITFVMAGEDTVEGKQI
jgi:hypothetical protein